MSPLRVVSYRNSTSNHNRGYAIRSVTPVVSYRNSTSNHNTYVHRSYFERLYLIEILHQTTTNHAGSSRAEVLYLIEILHQTTTRRRHRRGPLVLYLIEILHQTTTSLRARTCSLCCILSKFYIKPQQRHYGRWFCRCCILSKFYIKPQLVRNYYGYSKVVSYRNSTSNHNHPRPYSLAAGLYLIEILHQTTTSGLILIDKVLLTGCLPL